MDGSCRVWALMVRRWWRADCVRTDSYLTDPSLVTAVPLLETTEPVVGEPVGLTAKIENGDPVITQDDARAGGTREAVGDDQYARRHVGTLSRRPLRAWRTRRPSRTDRALGPRRAGFGQIPGRARSGYRGKHERCDGEDRCASHHRMVQGSRTGPEMPRPALSRTADAILCRDGSGCPAAAVGPELRLLRTEPRGVVGFEDRVLGAHGPLVIAAVSVSRSPWSSAMEVSEK
jgi:hypothetical protein